MTLYVDGSVTDGQDYCIAFEKGDSLCGDYNCRDELTDEYTETVWKLLLEERLHDQCDCRERLLEKLGVPDDEEELRKRHRAATVGGGR